jgi:hypothetical protein
MDTQLFTIEGFGEAGFDSEASPGNGSFYVKLYSGEFNSSGYDSLEEAIDELKYIYKKTYIQRSQSHSSILGTGNSDDNQKQLN